jgi:uncharacterized protein (TIGR03435 family)
MTGNAFENVVGRTRGPSRGGRVSGQHRCNDGIRSRITSMACASPRIIALLVSLSALMSATALAQPPRTIKFEVASVKPAARDKDAPSVMQGGPGTSDPERIVYQRQSLSRLLCVAYGIDFDQISGPSWLSTELYTVTAKVPPDATKEDLRLMWQDLLAERFHLKAHVIQKDFPVYELSVAKGGPKLQKSGEGPVKEEPGFPVPRAGEKWALSIAPPRNTRQTFRDYSMAELVQQLRWPLGATAGTGTVAMGRIIDKTGLDGRYDFTLEFAGYRAPGGAFPPPLADGQTDTAPPLFDAVRQQLGLTLEQKKAPLDVLVVDSVDRAPAEN